MHILLLDTFNNNDDFSALGREVHILYLCIIVAHAFGRNRNVTKPLLSF